MSSPTPESYTESFPKPNLTKINGLPDYDTIKKINDELSQNAASVHTNLGGGNHGFLGLTVKPTIYATISATAFATPINPAPPVLTGLTGPQISAANRRYDADRKKFADYVALQNALKKQLIAAVEDIYLEAISAPYVGFGNLTILQMLDHLYDIYAKILPDDLVKNTENMSAPWDPSQPFEYLIRQIQNGIDFAAHGLAPLTMEQIVNTAYTVVASTGLFHEECKKWRKRRPPLAKDWPNFKTFFSEAYTDWRIGQRQTMGQKYGTANAAPAQNYDTETIEAIANLATATASDRATTAILTNTNARLTEELRTTQQKLVEALEKIAQLSTSRVPFAPRAGQENENRNNRPLDRHYCWTHGYLSEHTSARCTSPAENHQKHATARKPMGGSKAKYDKWIKRVTRVEN